MSTAQKFLRTMGAGILLTAGVVSAQAPAVRLEFEVASIKTAPSIQSQVSSGRIHVGMKIDGARVDIGSMSLGDLIQAAFKVKPYQVSGPAWMSADIISGTRFDIMAKMPEGTTAEQVPEMLQALLEDRFKLAIHRENKEHAMYALVVAKGGPKLKESVPEPDAPAGADAKDQAKEEGKQVFSFGTPDGSQARISQDGKGGMVVRAGKTGTMHVTAGADGSIHMEASQMTLAALAEMISRFVDRPVEDMTELKGTYQVGLDLSMADILKMARASGAALPGAPRGGDAAASPADAASDPSASSIFETVQKLGLKLEPRKAPVEVIVIDHLEKTPTEN